MSIRISFCNGIEPLTPAFLAANDKKPMNALLVLSSFPDAEIAREIARILVEEQCAACANLIPGAESIYWWKGVIETSVEVIALFKTTPEQYPQLAARLKELHPYELPETIAFSPSEGNPDFLQWIAANTGR